MKTAGERIVKRCLDIAVSFILLVFLCPFLITIALMILLTIGPPILFRQMRPGLSGDPFVLFKFRTMTGRLDGNGRLLPDNKRLTSFGKLLRKTSLDELPELFNVIKGDMSLVGPRPLLMQYLERYAPEQMRRHDVQPGITGWAQINGRNSLSWEDKFILDVWYVDHYSLMVDLRILGKTVWKVISGEGISQPGQATMEEFLGITDKSALKNKKNNYDA